MIFKMSREFDFHCLAEIKKKSLLSLGCLEGVRKIEGVKTMYYSYQINSNEKVWSYEEKYNNVSIKIKSSNLFYLVMKGTLSLSQFVTILYMQIYLNKHDCVF